MRLRRVQRPAKRPEVSVRGCSPVYFKSSDIPDGLLVQEPIYVDSIRSLLVRVARIRGNRVRSRVLAVSGDVASELWALRRDESVESMYHHEEYLFCSIMDISSVSENTIAFAKVHLASRKVVRFPVPRRFGARLIRVYGARNAEEILAHEADGGLPPKRWLLNLRLNRWRAL